VSEEDRPRERERERERMSEYRVMGGRRRRKSKDRVDEEYGDVVEGRVGESKEARDRERERYAMK
jgi:hypothetical protein